MLLLLACQGNAGVSTRVMVAEQAWMQDAIAQGCLSQDALVGFTSSMGTSLEQAIETRDASLGAARWSGYCKMVA